MSAAQIQQDGQRADSLLINSKQGLRLSCQIKAPCSRLMQRISGLRLELVDVHVVAPLRSN